MFRAVVFLLGAAVLGAFMAAVYYAPDSVELRESATAYNPGPGDIQQDTVHPSLPGSDITYHVEVLQGTVDVYVMEQDWAASLAADGNLALDQPFSYLSEFSKTHVNGSHSFTIQSDGVTSYVIVFDNTDNFYEGDAGENGTQENARIRTTARFLEEEERSLTFGYLAAIPSVLLVLVTFGRQYWRWRNERT